MVDEWSPRCPKCGGAANAVIRPTPDQLLGGRLRPVATAAFPKGTRVRCTRCRTWFVIAEGTVWEPRKAGASKSEPVPDEGDTVGERRV